ncbi:phosphate ABC transporter permease [Thiomicrospira aerophila AL3]|uniref:Phosphate transport system permease protein PstA n=1 Tax=Thiomicrospira aerophila AL3 TaxID=717772 RepID=W0DU15_9GAMM|nr:phosphate ABC transporter permease PstA [Thiomicrospira aerophila]AHF00748.1 phosphate ABC transporter permease [Thiomicrospira aerophila AL3]
MKTWMNKGEHWVWFSASAVSIAVVLVFGLLLMISARGLSHFWPHQIYEFKVEQAAGPAVYTAEIHNTRVRVFEDPQNSGMSLRENQILLKTANRDVFGIDFRWINESNITAKEVAKGITVFERYSHGDLFGYINAFEVNGERLDDLQAVKNRMHAQLKESRQIRKELRRIEKGLIGGINYQLEQIRFEQRRLDQRGQLTQEAIANFDAERARLNQEFSELETVRAELYNRLRALGTVVVTLSDGSERRLGLDQVVDFWQPNDMHLGQKTAFFLGSIKNFLLDDPREANTEGGVFPAIVGTFTMVILMTLFVMPMGILAAIYMREYAKEGPVLKLVRISINNLAGVPSIVFGIFGLGFFVYVLGYSIDQMFYSHVLPNPTFGTPGLLWAALTMALLTLPVVIVSTDEGLSRIPRALREGGLALGATKLEVILRIILPMTTPAIMTGLILAIARAAGEVAPLMLVGVVKLVSELPVNTNPPFVHLDQKFMHLGFHIYDTGFQSPNVEAAQPLVYATSLLLVLVIVSLNLGAIMIRNRLREKYKSLEH